MADRDMNGVDVNSLNEEQLVQISGIGPETARAIVRYREEHGPIRTRKELDALLDAVSLVPSDERNATFSGGGPPGSAAAEAAEAGTKVGGPTPR